MFDDDLWETTLAIDCPVEPVVWLGTIQQGNTQVMLELRPTASPTTLAGSLRQQIGGNPVLLGRILLIEVDFVDAVTVLLPLTSWGTFLRRVARDGRVRGEHPAVEPVGAIDADPLRGAPGEVPWSALDGRRLSWLERLLRAAVGSGAAGSEVDGPGPQPDGTALSEQDAVSAVVDLLDRCIECAVQNEDEPIQTVSANRRVIGS